MTTAVVPIVIDGLPEGLEIVRYGSPLPGQHEYVLTGRGEIQAAGTGVIVRCVPGWNMAYDGGRDEFRPFRVFDEPKTLSVVVANGWEEQLVRAALKSYGAPEPTE